MSMKHTTFPALFSVLVLALPACDDSAEAKEMRESTQKALEDISEWSEARWNEFVASSEQQLKDARAEAERLREQLAEKGEKASEALSEKLDAVDSKLDSVGEDIDRMTERGQDAAGDVAEGVRRAFEEIGKSLEEAEKSLGGESAGGSDTPAGSTGRDG